MIILLHLPRYKNFMRKHVTKSTVHKYLIDKVMDFLFILFTQGHLYPRIQITSLYYVSVLFIVLFKSFTIYGFVFYCGLLPVLLLDPFDRAIVPTNLFHIVCNNRRMGRR